MFTLIKVVRSQKEHFPNILSNFHEDDSIQLRTYIETASTLEYTYISERKIEHSS